MSVGGMPECVLWKWRVFVQVAKEDTLINADDQFPEMVNGNVFASTANSVLIAAFPSN